MTKDKFSKIFLILFVFLSGAMLIITENYKYIYSKTFLIIIIVNILLIIVFFLKKIRFVVFINFIIICFIIFLTNLFLFIKNPAEISRNKKFEYIQKNSKVGNDLYPTIPPITHLKDNNIILPLSGLSNVQTVSSNENGYWGTFKSDEFGFNNDKGQLKKVKNSNLKKLIFLGDSMTMGSAVSRKDNFVDILNSEINIDALNLAYGGNGFLLSFATYQEYASKIKNAKIFLCFYEGNDFYEFEVEEKNNNILKKYYNEEFVQDLINKNFEKDKIVASKYKKELHIVSKSKKDNFNIYFEEIIKLGQIRKIFGILNNKKEYYAFSEANFLEFSKLIKLLNERIKKNNSELIFIYIPAREHFFIGNPFVKPYKKVLQIVKNNNVKLIDLYKELSKSENPLIFFPSGIMRHFNPIGHKKISKIIKNNL